ncbi:MAG: PEP-CTERM sorting domain-containing protein, partial [Phycisphaerae bacterium]
ISSGGPAHAFLWTAPGPMDDLGTLSGQDSMALAINDVGDVAGGSTLSGGAGRAFLWSPPGPMQDIGALDPADDSIGWGINDLREVVGVSVSYDGVPQPRAFLWSQGGGMQQLPTLGGDQAWAVDINNGSEIAGAAQTAGGEIHAVVWDGGGVQDLSTLGGPIAQANAINDNGQVVGDSLTPTWDKHAFFYGGDGGMQDIGTLGGSDSLAYDINELAEVVGTSAVNGSELHAFVWSQAGGIQDLNDLIDPASGWVLEAAYGINDDGWIVGVGTNAAGQRHGFLLVPDPATLSLLAVGMGVCLGGWRRRLRWG